MKPGEITGSLRAALRRCLPRLAGRKAATSVDARRSEYQLVYARFRELLTLNDAILRFISDIEEKASGRRPFALAVVYERVRQACLRAALIVKNLNQITGNRRHSGLYDAVDRLQQRINATVAQHTALPEGPFVRTLSDLRRGSAQLAGLKAATLGEIHASLGLPVPEGFVVTTSAFSHMLRAAGQVENAARLEAVFEEGGRHKLEAACEQLRARIAATPAPPRIAEAIAAGSMRLPTRELLAVRSSAVGEDGAASHAGQYLTKLNVPRDLLVDAWREVVASAFSPDAVIYRYLRGVNFQQCAMAVLILPMLQPRAAGTLFSRDVRDLNLDHVLISITRGTADALVSGRVNATEVVLRAGAVFPLPPKIQASIAGLLLESEVATLVEAARRLEEFFQSPQDVEWLVQHDGSIFFLQTRPVAIPPPAVEGDPLVVSSVIPLFEGGHAACPGIGIGPVHKLATSAFPPSVPEGCVVLARTAGVELARFMPSCAALITEVGSPTAHMSILSREFGVPTLVGAAGAFERLPDGGLVTVDAMHRRVYLGALSVRGGTRDRAARIRAASPLAGSAAVRSLGELAQWIVPLNLRDPAAREFAPEHCRTLHDVTRYVHESVYRAMFSFSEEVQKNLPRTLVLQARLPLIVRLFDVGGGVHPPDSRTERIDLSEIASQPARAFLHGLIDPNIQWNRPRNISARGFLSVLGQSMVGTPAETEAMAETSFCVLSGTYMNFAVRMGYHFSTVDTWCSDEVNRNYIHFHFTGGGAGTDRRERRQRFLSRILLALEFQVRSDRDFVAARMDKCDLRTTLSALEQLGRLTLCARQLDMLMDTDASPDFFADAFLRNDLSSF